MTSTPTVVIGAAGCYGRTRPRTTLRAGTPSSPPSRRLPALPPPRVSATGRPPPMEGTDMDVDAELMQKFSCMGTTDKDVLITEFQRLLGFQLNPAGCAFFLDMTNWNLQAAIGAYYDFESPNVNTPSMSFVEDVTIGEGESVPPDTPFTKTWRIQNTGAEAWPPGVCLKYIGGDQFGHVNTVMVKSLDPQEITDVSVQMRSPTAPGMYQGQWRMCTATGLFYGDVIWVILSVEVGGLLGVTQQLSSFETEFNTQPQRNVQEDFNPFASPQKNKHDATDNSFRDPGGAWEHTQEPIQQDQNGLSHNAVNRASNGLQTNLSVVTYGQLFLYQQFESSCTTTRLGLHYLLPKKQRKNNNGVTGFVSHRCVIHLRSSVPISIVGLLSSASSTTDLEGDTQRIPVQVKGQQRFNVDSLCFLYLHSPVMANSVGGLSEGTAYGPRIGMTGDSLALLERNRGAADPWDMVETKPNVDALERGLPGLYLSCFDMPLAEDATWLAKVSEAPPMAHMGSRDEPEQCPVIDSQEQGLSPAGLQGQEEERSLEQVQSMVVGEVLKDIETACKLLNITPDPIEWNAANVQKWLLWTEHLYRLPHAGKAFQELTGKDLCAMSEEEFRQRSPQCGDTLHAHLDIWKSAAWMKERCSAGDTKTAGTEELWSEADSSCSGQPIHLWQFLRELLLKPHSYGRCIRWLNKEKGSSLCLP
ncbi:K09442 SAM pointed domain-containing ETS transcription factor [Scophthalmus maximus]|uniref:Protein ILRUN n=1 Tax=Scophthalmus maximus TaxID=52904 RepID=A0A2U9BF40_SCOMX|nr:K09442 SAM pointed domain-containing ETS transcription factor [Scophthalmus maximus]